MEKKISKKERLKDIFFCTCLLVFVIYIMYVFTFSKTDTTSIKEQIIKDYPNITMEELAPLTERNLVDLQHELNQQRIKDLVNKSSKEK